MAGLYGPGRPSSSSHHHLVAGATASSAASSFASRLLLLLTALPLALAAFAFVLQWRGGVNDPASRWPSESAQVFPGMAGSSPLSTQAHVSSSASPSDCAEILGGSASPTFPYYRGWRFDVDAADLKPKVRFSSCPGMGC